MSQTILRVIESEPKTTEIFDGQTPNNIFTGNFGHTLTTLPFNDTTNLIVGESYFEDDILHTLGYDDLYGGWTPGNPYIANVAGKYKMVIRSSVYSEDDFTSGTYNITIKVNGLNEHSFNAINIDDSFATTGYIFLEHEVILQEGDELDFLINGTISQNSGDDVPVVKLFSTVNIDLAGSVAVVDLDMDQEESEIKGDLVSLSVNDIGFIQGLGTQEFVLPNTKTNNDFFKHAYRIDSSNETNYLGNEVSAQLIVDGNRISEGYLKLTSIINKLNGDIKYKCVFTDSLPLFKNNIKNKTLRDLDWSSYDHAYNLANITSSWDGDLFDGDIIYPNIYYGMNEGEDGYSYTYDTDTIDNSIFNGNPSNALPHVNFKPAIRVPVVINKIFNESGYQVSSSFFNGDLSFFGEGVNKTMDDMYLLNTPKEGKGVYDPVPNYFRGDASTNIGTGSGTITGLGSPAPGDPWSANSNYIWEVPLDEIIDVEIEDTTGAWDGSNFIVNAPGEYVITIQGKIVVSDGFDYHQIFTYITEFDEGISNFITNIPGGTPGEGEYPFTIQYVHQYATGEEINPQIRCDFNSLGIATGFFPAGVIDFEDVKVEIKTTEDIPDFVNVGLQLENIKQIDFIRAIQQQFNLVFWTNIEDPKIINVEPYDVYIAGGRTLDWTGKVDREAGMEITHPGSSVSSVIDFANKIDENDTYMGYVRPQDKAQGSFKFENDVRDDDSSTKIGEKLFSNTNVGALKGWDEETGYTTPMIIPHIYRREDDENYSYAFEPRLLFNNGKVELDHEYGLKDVDGTTTTTTYYLQSSPFTSMNEDDEKFDVNFRANGYSYNVEQQLGYDTKTTNTSYNRFWVNYLNNVSRQNARKVVLDVEFSPLDRLYFRPNDTIQIDNQEYLVDEIKGFNFSNPQTTEVVLLKKLSNFSLFTSVIEDEDDGTGVGLGAGLMAQGTGGREFIFEESGSSVSAIYLEDFTTEVSSSNINVKDVLAQGYSMDSTGTLSALPRKQGIAKVDLRTSDTKKANRHRTNGIVSSSATLERESQITNASLHATQDIQQAYMLNNGGKLTTSTPGIEYGPYFKYTSIGNGEGNAFEYTGDITLPTAQGKQTLVLEANNLNLRRHDALGSMFLNNNTLRIYTPTTGSIFIGNKGISTSNPDGLDHVSFVFNRFVNQQYSTYDFPSGSTFIGHSTNDNHTNYDNDVDGETRGENSLILSTTHTLGAKYEGYNSVSMDSGNYAVGQYANTILFNHTQTTAGFIRGRLPDATTYDGRVIYVITDGSINSTYYVRFERAGSDLINGASSYSITTPHTTTRLQAIDGNWYAH